MQISPGVKNVAFVWKDFRQQIAIILKANALPKILRKQQY